MAVFWGGQKKKGKKKALQTANFKHQPQSRGKVGVLGYLGEQKVGKRLGRDVGKRVVPLDSECDSLANVLFGMSVAPVVPLLHGHLQLWRREGLKLIEGRDGSEKRHAKAAI